MSVQYILKQLLHKGSKKNERKGSSESDRSHSTDLDDDTNIESTKRQEHTKPLKLRSCLNYGLPPIKPRRKKQKKQDNLEDEEEKEVRKPARSNGRVTSRPRRINSNKRTKSQRNKNKRPRNKGKDRMEEEDRHTKNNENLGKEQKCNC